MKTLKDVERQVKALQPGLAYEYNKVLGILYITDYQTNTSGMWLCKEHPQEIDQAYAWLRDQAGRRADQQHHIVYRSGNSLNWQCAFFCIIVVLIVVALTTAIV